MELYSIFILTILYYTHHVWEGDNARGINQLLGTSEALLWLEKHGFHDSVLSSWHFLTLPDTSWHFHMFFPDQPLLGTFPVLLGAWPQHKKRKALRKHGILLLEDMTSTAFAEVCLGFGWGQKLKPLNTRIIPTNNPNNNKNIELQHATKCTFGWTAEQYSVHSEGMRWNGVLSLHGEDWQNKAATNSICWSTATTATTATTVTVTTVTSLSTLTATTSKPTITMSTISTITTVTIITTAITTSLTHQHRHHHHHHSRRACYSTQGKMLRYVEIGISSSTSTQSAWYLNACITLS